MACRFGSAGLTGLGVGACGGFGQVGQCGDGDEHRSQQAGALPLPRPQGGADLAGGDGLVEPGEQAGEGEVHAVVVGGDDCSKWGPGRGRCRRPRSGGRRRRGGYADRSSAARGRASPRRSRSRRRGRWVRPPGVPGVPGRRGSSRCCRRPAPRGRRSGWRRRPAPAARGGGDAGPRPLRVAFPRLDRTGRHGQYDRVVPRIVTAGEQQLGGAVQRHRPPGVTGIGEDNADQGPQSPDRVQDAGAVGRCGSDPRVEVAQRGARHCGRRHRLDQPVGVQPAAGGEYEHRRCRRSPPEFLDAAVDSTAAACTPRPLRSSAQPQCCARPRRSRHERMAWPCPGLYVLSEPGLKGWLGYPVAVLMAPLITPHKFRCRVP